MTFRNHPSNGGKFKFFVQVSKLVLILSGLFLPSCLCCLEGKWRLAGSINNSLAKRQKGGEMITSVIVFIILTAMFPIAFSALKAQRRLRLNDEEAAIRAVAVEVAWATAIIVYFLQ